MSKTFTVQYDWKEVPYQNDWTKDHLEQTFGVFMTTFRFAHNGCYEENIVAFSKKNMKIKDLKTLLA